MIDLHQIGQLQSVIGQVSGLQAQIRGSGDPARYAGDPATLRTLSNSHQAAANKLQSIASQGQGLVSGVTGGGLWAGDASSAFAGHWSGVQGQVQDLASRHQQMAGALDGIAGQAERLNHEVLDVVAAIESWLGAAAPAVASLDVAAVAGLVAGGLALLGRWRGLWADLESFASGLPQTLSVDLALSLPMSPPPSVGGLGGVTTPLPGRPGILINVPGPKGPSILINVPGPKGPSILVNVPGPKGPSILINVPGPKLPSILINVPGPGGPSVVAAKPGKQGQAQGQRVPPPRTLPAFPGAQRVKPKTPLQGGGGMRARWKDSSGKIYEWDSQHGRVEIYDKRGKSLGEYDPNTGQQTKGPDPTRRVQP